MLLLKIVKCSDPLLWYYDLVGEFVPLIREEAACYISRERAGYTNIVHKYDAEIHDPESRKAR